MPAEPGAGQILVRVRASSLNFHDQAVALGYIPAAEGRILMSDGAGEVVSVGESVKRFAVGDRVMGTFFPDWRVGEPTDEVVQAIAGDTVDGFAREYAVLSAEAFTNIPRGWSYAEAATLPCAGVTAWRALTANGGIKQGDSVLTLGTGGVSVLSLQIAKAMGAMVIAISSSDEKLERLSGLGADRLINYQKVPEWGTEVQAITGGRGVDHVIEVGGVGTLMQSVAATRLGGHIALIGALAGMTAEFCTLPLIRRQIQLAALAVGSRSDQEDLVVAMDRFEIRPVIDSHFPLAALAQAFRHHQSQQHFGKICLEI